MYESNSQKYKVDIPMNKEYSIQQRGKKTFEIISHLIDEKGIPTESFVMCQTDRLGNANLIKSFFVKHQLRIDNPEKDLQEQLEDKIAMFDIDNGVQSQQTLQQIVEELKTLVKVFFGNDLRK